MSAMLLLLQQSTAKTLAGISAKVELKCAPLMGFIYNYVLEQMNNRERASKLSERLTTGQGRRFCRHVAAVYIIFVGRPAKFLAIAVARSSPIWIRHTLWFQVLLQSIKIPASSSMLK